MIRGTVQIEMEKMFKFHSRKLNEDFEDKKKIQVHNKSVVIVILLFHRMCSIFHILIKIIIITV